LQGFAESQILSDDLFKGNLTIIFSKPPEQKTKRKFKYLENPPEKKNIEKV
jgi:hypothetical protein